LGQSSRAKRGGGRPVLSLDEAEAEQRYTAELTVDLNPESSSTGAGR
jgi:hypothetical protein